MPKQHNSQHNFTCRHEVVTPTAALPIVLLRPLIKTGPSSSARQCKLLISFYLALDSRSQVCELPPITERCSWLLLGPFYDGMRPRSVVLIGLSCAPSLKELVGISSIFRVDYDIRNSMCVCPSLPGRCFNHAVEDKVVQRQDEIPIEPPQNTT